MEKIKIGMFGCSRGLDYAVVMNGTPDIDICAFCDNKPERLANAERVIPGKQYFSDFDEFLAWGLKNGMQAVFLANYFHEHTKFAIKVMEAGLYALSECIPAVSLKECVDLVRCAERTGNRYMFCENYPWMVGNLELTRLAKDPKMGEILYLEGEYNHHDTAAELHARSRGKYHWRNWEPRCFYITHSLAPIMMMSDGMPKYVSCQGAISPMQVKDCTFRAASEGIAMTLVKFDNGKVGRFTGCDAVAASYSAYRIFGEKGSAEWGDYTDNKVRLMYKDWTKPADEDRVNLYAPDLDALDPKLHDALKAGHGGSDYMVVQNIIKFVRDGIEPYFNVYRAAAIAATACYSLRSMLNNGEMFEIPDFRDPEACKAVENDDLTPFYSDDGVGGTIAPSITWTPDKMANIDVFEE